MKALISDCITDSSIAYGPSLAQHIDRCYEMSCSVLIMQFLDLIEDKTVLQK